MDINIERLNLNLIDQNLKKNFIKRMKIIINIKNIKNIKNINIYDKKREQNIKSNLLCDSKFSGNLEIFYNDFLENIFKLSKLHQLSYSKINITNDLKIIFYNKNNNEINLLKKLYIDIKFIQIKTLKKLFCKLKNIKNSYVIIDYLTINSININYFIYKIINNNFMINICTFKKYKFFLIKGKN